MNFLKPLSVATPLAISALALAGCHSSHNNRTCEEQAIVEDCNSVTAEREYNAESNQKVDANKPNLPRLINSNIIQYRNLSGNLVNVRVVDNATISLYSVITKHSTEDSPEIEDIGGFYADVEANISKAQCDESDNMTAQSSIYDLSGQNVIALRHLQCSTMFNKLFDIFTSPKSEGGENITVNEYTKMMDAWSSTGVRSNH